MSLTRLGDRKVNDDAGRVVEESLPSIFCLYSHLPAHQVLPDVPFFFIISHFICFVVLYSIRYSTTSSNLLGIAHYHFSPF